MELCSLAANVAMLASFPVLTSFTALINTTSYKHKLCVCLRAGEGGATGEGLHGVPEARRHPSATEAERGGAQRQAEPRPRGHAHARARATE